MANQSVDWDALTAKQFIIHPFMLSDVLKELFDIETGALEPIELFHQLDIPPQPRAPRPREAFPIPPAPERHYRIQYRLKMAEDWTDWLWLRRKPVKTSYKRRANAVAALGLCESLGYRECRVDEYWTDDWGNLQSKGRP